MRWGPSANWSGRPPNRTQAILPRGWRRPSDRDLYVELQRHHDAEGRPVPEEQAAEGGMIDIAYAQDLPLVATNDVYFPKPDLYDAHDALICISERAYVDPDRAAPPLTPQHHFKTPGRDGRAIRRPARGDREHRRDRPPLRLCRASTSRSCRSLPMTRSRNCAVRPGTACAHGWPSSRTRSVVEEYEARLTFELGIIEQMGGSGYFLIVADFIKWAKDHGIPVGPGRVRARGRWWPMR